MFKKKESALPPDPGYPDDLKKLGYFLTPDGFFKEINNPELNFNFKFTNDDRHNEMHREAFHKCTRRELYSHLADLGIGRLYLPDLKTEPNGPSEAKPHLPILATPADILKTRKRVVVVVNDSSQDLGVLAYRLLHRSYGLFGGSVLNIVRELKQRSLKAEEPNTLKNELPIDSDFDSDSSDDTPGIIDRVGNDAHPNVKMAIAKELHEQEMIKKRRRSSVSVNRTLSEKSSKSFQASNQPKKGEHKDVPGIIVMNTGQQYFSYTHNEAMTIVSWHSMPRKSHVHPVHKMDSTLNLVDGNRNPQEHIQFVFDKVINNPDFVNPDAEIYVVAIQSGAKHLMMLMDQEAEAQPASRQITALALIQPGTTSDEIVNPKFETFLRHRARAWVQPDNEEPANTPVSKPSDPGALLRLLEVRKDSSREKNINWLEVVTSPKQQDQKANAPEGTNDKVPQVMDPEAPQKSSEDATSVGDESTEPITEAGLTLPFSSYDKPICPTFSGGPGEGTVPDAPECVFPRVFKHVLDFFEEVAQDPVNYHNPYFKVPKPVVAPAIPINASLTAEELTQLMAQHQLQRNAELEGRPLPQALAEESTRGAGGTRAKSSVPDDGPKVEFGGQEVDEKLLREAGLDDDEDGDGGVVLETKQKKVEDADGKPIFAPEA